ncbi:MAG: glycosyltransferase family A protein [Patescibacteria group bacterium]
MIGCSIVVPTYNRVDYLKRCVNSLLNLDFSNFEIIIVNDNSTDSTRDYLKNLNRNKVQIVNHSNNLGPSESRNSGIKQASFDYIVFIDDDCLAGQDWLKNFEISFNNSSADFIIGQTYYVKENYKGYFPERLTRNINAKWPMGCNIAFKKGVFKKIGSFNKEYDKYHNEDSEIAIRSLANNYKFSRSVKAIVYHQAMNWTTESLLKSARNASVWPVLKKKYPENYLIFNPPIKYNIFINIEDYLYILLIPLLIPVLLIRYILHGKNDFKIFFTKWPIYLFLRRYYIYKEAVKNKILML